MRDVQERERGQTFHINAESRLETLWCCMKNIRTFEILDIEQ